MDVKIISENHFNNQFQHLSIKFLYEPFSGYSGVWTVVLASVASWTHRNNVFKTQMSSYSLPKITPVLVRYKKPSGESPPRFLTSHCRPIWSDDSNRQPCGTQDTQGFFWF